MEPSVAKELRGEIRTTVHSKVVGGCGNREAGFSEARPHSLYQRQLGGLNALDRNHPPPVLFGPDKILLPFPGAANADAAFFVCSNACRHVANLPLGNGSFKFFQNPLREPAFQGRMNSFLPTKKLSGGRASNKMAILPALLAVEANTVGGGFSPTPHQGSRHNQIFFRAADPITRAQLHT